MSQLHEVADREFSLIRKGYDPAEVRAFLTELCRSGLLGEEAARAAACAAAEADAAEILAAAIAEAEAITARAESEAAAVLAAAEAEHGERVAAAQAFEAAASRSAEQLLRDAEAGAQALRVRAESHARETSAAILDSARHRLQRLLDAEVEVHVRLSAAFATVNAPAGQPLDREDETLLDLAFDEFFASDIEHDASRAWILSPPPGT